MEERFTISEFKKYLESCKCFREAVYFLSGDKIREANESEEDEDEEVCLTDSF